MTNDQKLLPCSLSARIKMLSETHGGLRSLSRVLNVDVGYLSRMASGEKQDPSEDVLSKLGLRKVVRYEDTRADQPQAVEGLPDFKKVINNAALTASLIPGDTAYQGADFAVNTLIPHVTAMAAQIAELEANLNQAREERDSFQRVGIEAQTQLAKGKEGLPERMNPHLANNPFDQGQCQGWNNAVSLCQAAFAALRAENGRLWTVYHDQHDKRTAAEIERNKLRAELDEALALIRDLEQYFDDTDFSLGYGNEFMIAKFLAKHGGQS